MVGEGENSLCQITLSSVITGKPTVREEMRLDACPDLRSFLDHCLEVDSDKRSSASHALELPFLQLAEDLSSLKLNIEAVKSKHEQEEKS